MGQRNEHIDHKIQNGQFGQKIFNAIFSVSYLKKISFDIVNVCSFYFVLSKFNLIPTK